MKNTSLENLDQLEAILDYRFRDQDLLTQAMTHRSWAHEQVSPRAQRDARNLHNEALEFLGDSILGLIVADYLFKAYPNATEGELSRMKHRLVSAPTLAKSSIELSLGEFVRFGRGEERAAGGANTPCCLTSSKQLPAQFLWTVGWTPREALSSALLAKSCGPPIRWRLRLPIRRRCFRKNYRRRIKQGRNTRW